MFGSLSWYPCLPEFYTLLLLIRLKNNIATRNDGSGVLGTICAAASSASVLRLKKKSTTQTVSLVFPKTGKSVLSPSRPISVCHVPGRSPISRVGYNRAGWRLRRREPGGSGIVVRVPRACGGYMICSTKQCR